MTNLNNLKHQMDEQEERLDEMTLKVSSLHKRLMRLERALGKEAKDENCISQPSEDNED